MPIRVSAPDPALLRLARALRIRDRALYTGDGTVRVRYQVLASALVFGVTFSALSLTASVATRILAPGLPAAEVVAQAPAEKTATESPALAQAAPRFLTNLIIPPSASEETDAAEQPAQLAEAAPVQTAQPKMEHSLTLRAGETMSGLLSKAGLSSEESMAAIDAMREHLNPRSIKAGQKIDVKLQPAAGDTEAAPASTGGTRFAQMTIPMDPLRTLVVERAGASDYRAHMQEKTVEQRAMAGEAVIQSSLFEATGDAGIPRTVAAEAMKILSHQVDFQRQIQRGDRIQIFYDSFVTQDGHVARTGDIRFVALQTGGRDIRFYHYETADGRSDYFDDQGRSIRKALLMTPVDGARMSSGFGMRHHPILGYSKMHKGVDFAAPTGTPIYSAGDGRVEKIGWVNGYGKYIKIRHNGSMSTAYAHMSRFNPSLKQGARVKQGEVIGYVGTTGRSTGPHLHYEVVVNGKQVNPRSLNLPSGEALTGRDLRNFKQHIERMKREYDRSRSGLRLAGASAEDRLALRDAPVSQ